MGMVCYIGSTVYHIGSVALSLGLGPQKQPFRGFVRCRGDGSIQRCRVDKLCTFNTIKHPQMRTPHGSLCVQTSPHRILAKWAKVPKIRHALFPLHKTLVGKLSMWGFWVVKCPIHLPHSLYSNKPNHLGDGAHTC